MSPAAIFLPAGNYFCSGNQQHRPKNHHIVHGEPRDNPFIRRKSIFFSTFVVPGRLDHILGLPMRSELCGIFRTKPPVRHGRISGLTCKLRRPAAAPSLIHWPFSFCSNRTPNFSMNYWCANGIWWPRANRRPTYSLWMPHKKATI